MFGTAIIVFREVLEAALIIGIVAAATRDIVGRRRWLVAGLLAGLAGAGLVAASTQTIAAMASGIGQELFNALVLGIAVLMLAWHNIWMASHGAALASEARTVSGNILAGRSECSILFIVVGLAVLREGSETVLFLYGIATGQEASANAMLLGGLMGVVAGIGVGYALYSGLLRIPLRWFFAATSMLVLLLAAGMAAQAARYLIQADILPSLGAPIWDSSALLPEHSALGVILHGLAGYEARPTGMQLVFYLATLGAVLVAMRWRRQQAQIQPSGV